MEKAREKARETASEGHPMGGDCGRYTRTFVGSSGFVGSTKPVGWICTRSMSMEPAPMAIASFMPSPVAHTPLVVGKATRSGRCLTSNDVFVRSLAKPPVARTVCAARSSTASPVASTVYRTPSTAADVVAVSAPSSESTKPVRRHPVRRESAPDLTYALSSR